MVYNYCKIYSVNIQSKLFYLKQNSKTFEFSYRKIFFGVQQRSRDLSNDEFEINLVGWLN